ncbi:hypothetical protein [Hydrogenophaga sp.]|uniref:hypothetical protein n=1 Tax=Hydrogenophaga sp. TaxID=1904254 RepID=UPI00272F94E8|nr:hypothetical protein [Hydrogenophaga sp.]MDP2074624.1 hypothetical protein [Hydrogenophaga sp.]MDP3106407.1 hypothetical protein [Hydrogenophaga sp.]
MTEQSLPRLPTLQQGDRINWEQVVLDIQRSAWLREKGQWTSLRAIAQEVGRTEGWVWNLKNIPCTEPKFHDGLLLIGLWVEKTGKLDLPLSSGT